MRYCNKCESEIKGNQGFCTSCGSTLVDETNINTKSKDKMVIVGIVTIAIIGAIFSTIGMIKKISGKEEVAIESKDSINISDELNNDSLDVANNYYEDITYNYEEGSYNDESLLEVSNYYIDKYKDRDFIIPSSDSVELDFKALNDYNSEQLLIAKNELLARYGYIFNSQPNLQAYFESKSWYKANPNYSGELLKEVEEHNLGMIKSLEFLKFARESNTSITRSFVLPNSNTSEITISEIAELNDWELIVARNEIFARYGLAFSTKELLQHFKERSWFVIDSSLGNDMPLTAIENKNVTRILDEEKRRIELRFNNDLGE